MTTEAREPVLIAVELGAEWPRWMSDLIRQSPRRVIAQEEGEASLGFAERAFRVADAVASGSALSAAVVLCNERTDAAQDCARRSLAEKLLPGLGAAGRLVLASSALASEAVRESLDRLARDIERGRATPLARFEDHAASKRGPRRRRVAKVA